MRHLATPSLQSAKSCIETLTESFKETLMNPSKERWRLGGMKILGPTTAFR